MRRTFDGHKFQRYARPFERLLHHETVLKRHGIVVRTLPKEYRRIACVHLLFDRPLPLKHLVCRLFPEEECAGTRMCFFPHREDGITQNHGRRLGKAVLLIAEFSDAPAACDVSARRKPADGIVIGIDLPFIGMAEHKAKNGGDILLRGRTVRPLPYMVLPDDSVEAELVESRCRREALDERAHIPISAARQDKDKRRFSSDEKGIQTHGIAKVIKELLSLPAAKPHRVEGIAERGRIEGIVLRQFFKRKGAHHGGELPRAHDVLFKGRKLLTVSDLGNFALRRKAFHRSPQQNLFYFLRSSRPYFSMSASMAGLI